MLDELLISSSLLCAAIDRYSSVCLAIQRSFARGENPHITTPQLPVQIDAEVRLVASLEAKLQKAKAAISWSRNHSNRHTTVNSLPPELLAYIFQLVRKTEPCAKRNYGSDKKAEPMYPAVLSQVCSRWRKLSFSTPALWTHLDISTSTSLNRHCLDGLMRLHSKQSGHLPLDLHVFDPPGYEISYLYPDSTRELVAHVASRVASFDLNTRAGFDYTLPYDILSTLFDHCSPGELTRLTLTQHGEGYEFIRGYPMPEDEDEDFDDQCLTVDQNTEQLEEILSHISVLRLDNLFPLWSSRAYHDLVELRLTGWQTVILESELIGILRSSPDLRILQFSLVVPNLLPANNYVLPVYLNNLEVLDFANMRTEQLNSLLGWLAPGSKPLQLAFKSGYGESQPQLREEDSRCFFSRSCLARAYVKYMNLFHVLELLDLSPNLQVLAVRGIKYQESDRVASLASKRQLECFHMIHCSITADLMLALGNNPMLNIKVFSFYRCSFYLDGGYIPESRVASRVEELSRDYPGVKFVVQNHEGPNPIYNWDLFASYRTEDLD